MTGAVLVVGGINADLVIETRRRPGPGETVLGSGYVLGHGGKGANQAVAAAVAGAAVAMVGAVGDDAWGREQLAGLTRFGVDVRGVRITADTPTGLAAISVTPDGENAILVAPGANHAIEPAGLFDSFQDGAFGSAGAVRVVVAQCELKPDVIEETARFARMVDARLIINAAPVIELSAQALAAADPLVVNEHEARDVLRLIGGAEQRPALMTSAEVSAAGDPHARGGGDGGGRASVATTSAGLAMDVLHVTRAKSVVVTLGAEGAMIATTAGARAIVGEKVSVVDTTGAGDTFVGTLAARLANYSDLDGAVRDASSAAARCVTWPGARPPRAAVDT